MVSDCLEDDKLRWLRAVRERHSPRPAAGTAVLGTAQKVEQGIGYGKLFSRGD